MRCTGLIKSNRPLFHYLIFGKTLDKMFQFQYIPKLITCNASFWSSDTKQWHVVNPEIKFRVCNWQHWRRISRFIIRVWKCDRRAYPNIARSLIWKSVIVSSMLWVLLNWLFTFQPWKIFGADIKNMSVRSIVLYQDFFKVIPKAKLGFHSHGNVKQGAVSIRKTVLPGMAIPMLKIRRPNGRLIFNMEIAIRR